MTSTFFSSLSKLYFSVLPKRKLQAHEQMVLDAFKHRLTRQNAGLLDLQVGQANLIQSQMEGAKICFYYNKAKAPPAFPLPDGECHAADVFLAIGSKGEDGILRSRIYIVNGKFFSIEFAKRPARFVAQHNAELKDLVVSKIDLLLDL